MYISWTFIGRFLSKSPNKFHEIGWNQVERWNHWCVDVLTVELHNCNGVFCLIAMWNNSSHTADHIRNWNYALFTWVLSHKKFPFIASSLCAHVKYLGHAHWHYVNSTEKLDRMPVGPKRRWTETCSDRKSGTEVPCYVFLFSLCEEEEEKSLIFSSLFGSTLTLNIMVFHSNESCP